MQNEKDEELEYVTKSELDVHLKPIDTRLTTLEVKHDNFKETLENITQENVKMVTEQVETNTLLKQLTEDNKDTNLHIRELNDNYLILKTEVDNDKEVVNTRFESVENKTLGDKEQDKNLNSKGNMFIFIVVIIVAGIVQIFTGTDVLNKVISIF